MPKLENKKKASEQANEEAQKALIRARTLCEGYAVSYTDIESTEDLLAKVKAAKDAGVQPVGLPEDLAAEVGAKAVPAPAKKASVIPPKAKKSAEAETEDIEITSPDQLKTYQESGKLHGWGGWYVEVKDAEGNVIDEVPAKNKKTGVFEFVPGAKGVARVLAGLLLAILVSVPAFAGNCASTDEACLGNQRWSVQNDGDLVPTTATSYDIGSSSYPANDVYVGGDLYTQGTLKVTGRVNATLTLASSSTAITGSNVPYALIRKNIGGAGNDNAGVGTELANGKPGAQLVIRVDSLASGSSWIVTPATATGWNKLTFDAALEYADLLYVDDTIGWIIRSTNATIAGHV